MNTRIEYYLDENGNYSPELSEQRRNELKRLRQVNYPVLFSKAVFFLVSRIPPFKIDFKNLRTFMYAINKAAHRGRKPSNINQFHTSTKTPKEKLSLSTFNESSSRNNGTFNNGVRHRLL